MKWLRPWFQKASVDSAAVPVFRVNDLARCVRWQIAECPIQVGGVYKVQAVEQDADGVHLCFERCTRAHNPKYFEHVE